MSNYAIVIHGGVGDLSEGQRKKEKEELYLEALQSSLDKGYKILSKGGSAVEAITESVIILENCELFNAAKGGVYTNKGDIELDASIMDGKTLQAGSVANVKYVKNPILLAKSILNEPDKIFLVGDGGLEYAKKKKLEIESKKYFSTKERYNQWIKLKDSKKKCLDHDEEHDSNYGTVGAVALDKKGNLGAGTSTGGLFNKKFNRVGDSSIIGAGTYANNNSCAISCTGFGEYFIRYVVGHEISCKIMYQGKTIEVAAADLILNNANDSSCKGGVIGIDKLGNITMPFNTKRMYRGYTHSNGTNFKAIF